MGCISLPAGRFSAFPRESFVALGCFDGLHLGHRALLERACAQAREAGVPLAVWSPVGAKEAPGVRPPQIRRRMLTALGVSFLITDDYAGIRDLSPEEFFEKKLIGAYRARALFCGENFSFGRGRSGNAATLEKLCRDNGVALTVLPCVRADGGIVSDTLVRDLLRRGDAARAACLLGAPYSFDAHKISGRRVGRKIGYPTVNLPLPAGFLLPYGVYAAALTRRAGKGVPPAVWAAAASVGVHPTFEKNAEARCELHLLGDPSGYPTSSDLLTVEFLSFLRPEFAFESPDALVLQIREDVAALERFFRGRELAPAP